MGSTADPANAADLPSGTLTELFLSAVDRLGDHPALRFFPGPGPQLESISYREAHARVKAVAYGLEELGVRRGERAAIVSENRPEWALADYGCLCAGVVGVPVYATLTGPQLAYILKNAGARLAFVSTREQMDKALEAGREADLDLTVVVFDEVGEVPDRVVPWSRFLREGEKRAATVPDDAFHASARSAEPDDVATILYTSGTTGPPKGVMLTHDNLHSNVLAVGGLVEITKADSTLSFLPLSHVLQRMVDFLLLSKGCTITYAHDLNSVADDLRIVRPTIVVSVPRLYEKVYNKVMSAEGPRGRMVKWAREVGAGWAEEKLAGRKPSAATRLAHAVADRLVFRKIRSAVGGRLRFFVSGGAPLEPAIAKFFFSAGVMIYEGYGLTETSPVTNLNTPDHFKIGTVGRPVPGTEVRIAEDGEILVRGPQVMKGYYELPEETRSALDPDGWFRTGDIGEIDGGGYLRITDRKKDLIVTASGKNIAPQPIENLLKTRPFVEQLVLVGDRLKFVSLLLVPSFEELEAWAKDQGVAFRDRKALLRDPRVHALIEREVLGGMDELANYERPKKVALLDREFTIEDGTLTPTQKVKRRVVQERLRNVVSALYDEANAGRTVFGASELAPQGED